MGIVLQFHAGISAGHKSGRRADRGIPVSRSIDKTNSAGTPFFDLFSQYQTCDCVVPIRSAKGAWPPAATHARSNAFRDMSASYANFYRLQSKNLCRLSDNRYFGIVSGMKDVDPAEFGRRVKRRREELGLSQPALARLSGQKQSNISWIEAGSPKRPERLAYGLAGPLQTDTGLAIMGTRTKAGRSAAP